MEKRAFGCALACVGSGTFLALADYLHAALPGFLISVVGVVLGLSFIHLYARYARDRWGGTPPDVVQMIGRDLGGVLLHKLADYRLSFGREWPWQERLLHEGLYALKWLGHFLIMGSLGWWWYRFFRFIGLVS